MIRIQRRGSIDSGSLRTRRLSDMRRTLSFQPWVEGLESRALLATITWNTAVAPTGGDWDTAGNWSPAQVPGTSDTAVINGLTGAGTVRLNSDLADSVFSLATDSSTTLEVISGSLSLGPGSSALGGPVIVDNGAALSVGAGASFTLGAGQTITDNGALSFANGDSVSFPTANYDTTQIVVNGTMSAAGTTFVNPGNAYESLNQIYIGTAGELMATSSTFDVNQLVLSSGSVLNQDDLSSDTFELPIYVPALDLPLLANNQSFQDVYILGGSLNDGQSLAVNLIGTKSTVNLLYIFPSGFTVNSGAALTVADDVSVQIGGGQTIADDGTITFGSGDQVSFPQANYDTTQILVNSGGILNATATTFINPGNAYESLDQIAVASGGEFIAANSTLDLDQLYLESGSILNQGDLTNDVFNLPIYVPALDLPLLTSNQSFQDVYLSYLGGSLGSGQSLALNLIGTQSTSNLFYIFPSGFTVNSGATLTIAGDVRVQIGGGQTIADDGTIAFSSGDQVSFPQANYDTTQIVVNSGGVLNATTTTFINPGNAYESLDQIAVASGGEFIAASSTLGLDQLYLENGSILNQGDLTSDVFNLPIYVPALDLPLLNSNQSFQDVYLSYLGGSLSSGQSLALNLIGTQSTANLLYIFPSGFTVNSGADPDSRRRRQRPDRRGPNNRRRRNDHFQFRRPGELPASQLRHDTNLSQ